MKFKIIGFLFMMSLCSGVFAQTKTVTGTVRDGADNSLLSGVAVQIKNTSVGTVTGSLGEFSLTAGENDTLIFVLVGMKEVRQPVGQRSVFDILMFVDESELDEVQVVAFGVQKKASSVASITTVKPSELRVSSYNLTSSFAGKIPGMISFQTSGEPGDDLAQFFVRGVTTFGYTQSPLILIDGFESNSYELARLQVDDIESFSIFKDASAAALYGARGANGVLYVITKNGQSSGITINARVDTHIATPTKMIQTVDGLEYMRLYNEGVTTRTPLSGNYYSEQAMESTRNGENSMIYPNINWYDELFKRTTINKRVNLNISGGGNIARFYVSGGFENENGLLKEDSRNKFNTNININRVHMRSNVVFNITKTTTLDTRIQAEFERYNGPINKASDIFNMVMNVNPVDFPAVYEPDEAHKFVSHTLFGNALINGVMMSNPYAEMVRGYNSDNISIVTMMATVQQDFDFLVKGLKFEGKGSVKANGTSNQKRQFAPFYYTVESYNQVTQEYKLFALNPQGGNTTMGEVDATNERGSSYYFEGRFNWNRVFAKIHTVGAMVVGTLQETSNLVAGTVFTALPARNAGISGRATYDYDNRYFGEFNFGYNGSEKFTGAKRFGFFPSIGGAWLVSNEKFWKPVKFIDLLKLRATYGLNGNDGIAKAADRFNFLSQISKGGSAYTWGLLHDQTGAGYTISRYANANISWEISRKVNLGLEINALNKMLKFQLDIWKDWRSDIYQERKTFAASTGLVEQNLRIFGNIGKVESIGYESSLDVEKIFPNGWLLGRFNFTYSKNKITVQDEEQFRDKYLSNIGHNTGTMRGLVAERLFVDDYETQNSPRQDWGYYQAGDIKYKDINGDGRINKNDMVPMGYPRVPEVQYGFGLSGGYKNFDLSFFFQGNSRVSFFIHPDGIAPLVGHRNALEIVARDYWTEANPNVHAFWPRLSVTTLQNNTQASSWWLRNGTFLRMKSVEVGYNIKGIDKLLLQSGRLYFSVENVFYVSTFKLWDPEMGDSGLGYPPNRRFNIGLLLQF